MKWENIKSNSDGSLIVPKSWIYPYFYEALNILFRTENALRVFVYSILKNEFYDKWSEEQIFQNGKSIGTISTVVEQRKKQTEKFGYLGYRVSSPMMFLNAGELIGLIMTNHWILFKPYFNASKEIVQTKLDEIGDIRNGLAHFRPLRIEDVEVLKTNSSQILSGVNEYINSMLNCHLPVPTNNESEWYKNIKSIGDERIKFQKDAGSRWIKLVFEYNCLTINYSELFTSWKTFTLTKLNSPSILTHFPLIRRYITYLSDWVQWLMVFGDSLPQPIIKDLSLIFSEDTLDKYHEIIKEEILKIINLIDKETELILSDNLAKGILIESAQISLKKLDEEWKLEADSLNSKETNETELDYWPGIASYNNFITKAKKFPWMPISISNFDFRLDK
ncbi:MAG: hypothetical protein ABFD08_18745 [Syntrophomonas sp.]